MSRPNSTILHHAIATGDIETVQNLLKQGVIDADARLQIDDEILESASRESYPSIHNYRQKSTVKEAIMEKDSPHGSKIKTEGESDVAITVNNEDVEEKDTKTEIEDIDKIMEECQNEIDEENIEIDKLEMTVIEVPQKETNADDQMDGGEDYEVVQSIQQLKSEENEEHQSLTLNNNRCSLADVIDLRLKDDNEGLLERAASVCAKDMTETGDEKSPRKIIPRLKRKLSLKFTKKSKTNFTEDEDEEDDLKYVNLVKTRNVDDEQLEENFEGVAFFEAVRDGMEMIVQTLLETSNNYQLNLLDENGFTPAMQAAWHGQPECLEILLSHGANIELQNAVGCTATHFAAGQGHTDCLQLLINDDAEQVNAKTKYGATPLLLAAKGGYKDCMDILLKAGAEPNIQYRGNQNALLFAAGNGHYECIETLLEYDVDLNQPNSQQVTPLMRAVQQGHNTCVALLVDKGADLNLQDAYGRTAVHFAVEHNNPKGLKLLLQNGNNINLELKTKKGGSRPLDYAERFQNTKCAEIIENHINRLREEREKERELETQRQKVSRQVSCLSFKHFFRRRNRKNNESI